MISSIAPSRNFIVAFREAVFGKLLGHEEFLGDFELLVLRIAGHLYDLHPVEEGVGNAVQRIGRRDEHHLRKVEGKLQVMIGETRVLLGIEDLEQGARRIASKVGGHLVDLVEEEDGVVRPRLPDRLHDLARKGADVGLSMPADLGLVAQAAQADAHEASLERARDAPAEGCLARSRRPDQAEYRPARAIRELADRDELEDALLRLLHPVMVLVEGGAGLRDVPAVLAFHGPGKVGEPLAIDAQDTRLWRKGLELGQAGKLAPRLGQHLLGRPFREKAPLQLLDFGIVAVLAELAIDLLQLLAQVIFALVAVHAILDFRVDPALQVRYLRLALDGGFDGLEPFEPVLDPEEGLFAIGLYG